MVNKVKIKLRRRPIKERLLNAEMKLSIQETIINKMEERLVRLEGIDGVTAGKTAKVSISTQQRKEWLHGKDKGVN